MKECLAQLRKLNLSVEIPGFTNKEATEAFCMSCQFDKGYMDGDFGKELLEKQLGSRWPALSKSVLGGIQHVISVDNGAVYAELWYQGGNWYAVTGADLKKSIGLSGGFYAIAGITKGMKIQDAVPRFLEAFFGKGQPCGSCGK